MRPDTLKEAWKFGACLSRMRPFGSWTPIRTHLKEVVGGSGFATPFENPSTQMEDITGRLEFSLRLIDLFHCAGKN